MSLKDKLLAKKLKTGTIEVLGEKTGIRQLSGPERVELGDLPDDVKARYKFLVHKCSDLGKEVTEAEFEKLFENCFEEVQQIAHEVLKLSKLTADEQEELEKN